ncbi:DUF2188 domain-containing protein [Cobetia amphilecti]|uniref:DUF2188 domain-containing protein n=1 Tax=Cobetia amphilecti TaxID=1055104 RepID=A0ABT6UUZ8_9GAMM|nr:DUF2188 domain-containing protein [Cobetia amphilecti]MDI5886185.1 DUF2188 domain-containing protein [Cobetia amphilecti]
MPANVWVVVHGSGWAVKREGAASASKVFTTQQAAIDYGRDLARKDHVELLIQGKDGKIRDRDSHGNDPHPPKG